MITAEQVKQRVEIIARESFTVERYPAFERDFRSIELHKPEIISTTPIQNQSIWVVEIQGEVDCLITSTKKVKSQNKVFFLAWEVDKDGSKIEDDVLLTGKELTLKETKIVRTLPQINTVPTMERLCLIFDTHGRRPQIYQEVLSPKQRYFFLCEHNHSELALYWASINLDGYIAKAEHRRRRKEIEEAGNITN